MSSIMCIVYFWLSWIAFGMVWPAWIIRCVDVYDSTGTMLSWKTLQMTIIPMIITVFAVFPPISLSLAFLYIALTFIATIIT